MAFPIAYTVFLDIFFDGLPGPIDTTRYALPIVSFLLFFVTFILSVLTLVGEKRSNTFDRLRFSGVTNFDLVGGYLGGYLVLAVIQTVVVIISAVYFFELDLTNPQILAVAVVSILLAVASLLLGLMVSMITTREDQVIPFIPLVIVPSILFSGMVVDHSALPVWAQWFGRAFPPYYANNAIFELLKPVIDYNQFYLLLVPLLLYIAGVFVLNQVLVKILK